MEEEGYEGGKTLGEYLAGLRRHRLLVLGVAAPIAAVALVAALLLPATYRSSATILVQEQAVPPDLVRSTITSFADERIQVIGQQVMTRQVLLGLIERYGLYRKERKRLTTQEVLDRMRRDMVVVPVDASVSDRLSGQRVNTTIAFRISYDAPEPEVAQKVVQELVGLYLNENVKVRQESLAQTTLFLAQEADRAAKRIKEIEANLAAFKQRYADRMPASSETTVQLSDRTQSEIERVERELSLLQDRRLSLETQIASTRPNLPAATSMSGERVVTPEDRLRALEGQYAAAVAQYHDAHPEVRRLTREIDALKIEVERSAGTAAKSGGNADKDTVPARKPDNPTYISLVAQLESTRREIAHLGDVRDDLRRRLREYDARLQQIPQIEREYRDLTRDYDTAQAQYREIKVKQSQAEIAQELEKDRKAERFALGEPATLPEKPFKPNRPAIALIGLGASLGFGLGLAFLREVFDRSVKGPLELSRVVALPILTAIPYIETRAERVRDQQRLQILAVTSVLMAIAFVLSVHLFLKPIPDIWQAVLRRTGL